MSIDKTYSPNNIESKWYDYWMEHKLFKSTPDEREAFTIVIPPPNVTGVLHLGHTLNNTLQDILTRRARMLGKNACWVPGTDHASIATENKVIELLAEQGIAKKDLSREDFLKHAFEWKEKYGGIILSQLRRLGASCDWDRTAFTMDDDRYQSVVKVFVDLYNKGLIYRGARMVNWDPKRQTALSDEEVYHKDVSSKFYTVKYKIEGSEEYITIATTRPETIVADAAICVHSDDERYAHLKGKKAIVPLVDRAIPIIFDDYVDVDFGTGALKVTPAHDVNDHKLGMKHRLPVIDILNDNGTLNEKAVVPSLIGLDRFKARRDIAVLLEESGSLIKVEEIQNKVGCSERSHEVIEPKISTQWFCKTENMAKMALDKVEDGTVELVPSKFLNTYRHWMENIKDWCVSRQLWWGHRIPAYFLPNGEYVVAQTDEEALKLAQAKDPLLTMADLKQDEDVMDTWFSSWLWPLSVFNGIMEPENEEVKYYYPTDVLVTGHDIIFFWVARMVMAGYEFSTNDFDKKYPFKSVYFTGMVRDKKGRKMSKSLGNSPDLFKLLDQYGTDGVRTGVLFSSAAGNDLLFDEKQCEQGRNFANKIWNAYRLVDGWKESKDDSLSCPNEAVFAWFEGKLAEALKNINKSYDEFRVSEALMAKYKLVFDDFCGGYLEMVKPEYGKPIDSESLEKTIEYFERILKLLHPMMPFITEELWQNIRERQEGESIMYATWPEANVNEEFKKKGDLVASLISGIRALRNECDMSPKEAVEVYCGGDVSNYEAFETIIKKVVNVSRLYFTNEHPEQSKSFIVGTDEFFVPVELDIEDEIENLKKELDYNKGFLISVSKKLSNERFVSGAPAAVVEMEKKKQSDAEEKIKLIEATLERLVS